MANEFTKQLSEPNVVNAPQLPQATGSTVADVANLASTGLQAYQMFQNKEANKQRALLLEAEQAESAKGLNFANNLVADLSQVESPQKRKMIQRKREAQFLDANRDNPLAINAYFESMKGKKFKTSIQVAQEQRIALENKQQETKLNNINAGKALVAGMSTDPEYQELLDTMGSNVPDEVFENLALQAQGRKTLLAQKKAELDYASGQYTYNRTKTVDAREDKETQATNAIVAESQVKLNEITNVMRVPHTLMSLASSPQERIKAGKVVEKMLLKGREDLSKYVASLSPEENRLLDTDSLFKEYDTRVSQYKQFTDPDRVNKYSDAMLDQSVLAFNANQLVEGSPNGQSVALSTVLGLPIDPTALSQFQSETRNGKVPFKALGDSVAKIYDGNYTDIKNGVSIFKPELVGNMDNVPSEDVAKLAASVVIGASNPRNELHDPQSQKAVDNLINKGLESEDSAQAYIDEITARGQDPVDVTLKSFKNYVNGTLAPSLAYLRNEGTGSLSVELDGKGNIVLTPEAARATEFGDRTSVPPIYSGTTAPAVPLQTNVKSARIAREVSVDLNKRLDVLTKLMPDVDRATIAQMLLDGTKLAFRTEEQPNKDNQ